MSKKQIQAIIARRKALANQGRKANPMLAACIAAGGFPEHRAY